MIRRGRMRKILLDRRSACVQPLRRLIERQKHRTLTLWALDCGARILPLFEEKYPEDKRPRKAIEAARAWARGEIKMPAAKKAALAAHDAAKAVEDDPAACAAAHAMGHVVGTVHVETHALGVAFYGATAYVRAAEDRDADDVIAETLGWMHERLTYWEAHTDEDEGPWAAFLLQEGSNKERLLREKMEGKQG
jgi:hypothetical protein